MSFFLESVEDVRHFSRSGSAAVVTHGTAVTKHNRGVCPPGWASRDTTLILGCDPETGRAQEPTSAHWTFRIEDELIRKASCAVLLICCDRDQAGLHTQNRGAQARVSVNADELDLIGLTNIPEGHDDYFHQVAHQDRPAVPLIANCGTVYSFNIPVSFLREACSQEIEVSTDAGVCWDIDHVVLVITRAKQRIRTWIVTLLLAVIGAIVTAMATDGWQILFSQKR